MSLYRPCNYPSYVSRDEDFFAIMRGIQYFYLMHATKLNENSLSLSKSDGLTSKVYLRIYYSLRTRGCYLRILYYMDFPSLILVTRTMSYGLQVHFRVLIKNFTSLPCASRICVAFSSLTAPTILEAVGRRSAPTSLIRSRSRRRSYSRICCLEV